MPYPSNEPTRMEFGAGDRTSLLTIASQSIQLMNGVSPSTSTPPVKRSDFDAWKSAVLALNPNINNVGPWPDTR